MEFHAKIIYKTYLSYLPTSYPVQFYGMPNGKVYFFYARDNGINTEQEFVFAEHNEFFYDYASNKLTYILNNKKKYAINNEIIDKPNPEFTVFMVNSTISSYLEAFNKLNLLANEIISQSKAKKTILMKTGLEKEVRNNVG